MRGLLFIVTILAAVIPVAGNKPDAPNPLPLERAQEYYRTFIYALLQTVPELGVHFDVTDEASIDRVKSFIQRTKAASSSTDSSHHDISSSVSVAERFLLPEMCRYRLKSSITASTETLKQMLRENPLMYPQEENVLAAQIFVEKSTDADTSAALHNIASQLQTKRFELVARDYYRSIGSAFTGAIGRIRRGDIPDHNFEIFMRANADAPYFGPIEMPRGFLFGKIYDRITSTTDVFEKYAPRLLYDYQTRQLPRLEKALIDQEEPEHRVRILSQEQPGEPAGSQVAYVLDYTSITLREVYRSLPQFSGDRKDYRFQDAMVRKALTNHLLSFTTVAAETRRSPEYAFLISGIQGALRAYAALSHDDDSEPSAGSLKHYYEAHKTDLYSSSPRISAIVAELKRVQVPAENGSLARMQQKADFATMQKIREEFTNQPTTETLSRLTKSYTNVRFEVKPLTLLDEYPRAIQALLQDECTTGTISDIAADDVTYAFAYVLEVEAGEVAPFETVRHRVYQDRRRTMFESFVNPPGGIANY